MDNDYAKYDEAAEMLKVLAHPVRLCIVNRLLEAGECNVTTMHTCLNTPQSTISQHLQKLRSAGIVESRRSGLEIFYKVKNKKVVQLINDILHDGKQVSVGS